MENGDLVSIWEQIRLLHELVHRHGISIEGLQRTLDEGPERRLHWEKMASQDYDPKHQQRLGVIDDTIEKLKADDRA